MMNDDENRTGAKGDWKQLDAGLRAFDPAKGGDEEHAAHLLAAAATAVETQQVEAILATEGGQFSPDCDARPRTSLYLFGAGRRPPFEAFRSDHHGRFPSEGKQHRRIHFGGGWHGSRPGPRSAPGGGPPPSRAVQWRTGPLAGLPIYPKRPELAPWVSSC